MRRLVRLTTTVLLLLSFPLSGWSQTIERVEPPNWWVGMNWSSLQVLVYGEDLAGLQVRVEYDQVRLDKVVQTSNPNYLFVYLDIGPQAKAGMVPLQFYFGDRLVDTYDFELQAREPSAADIEGFSGADVIYLITPDRFANGDPTNDEYADMPDKLDRTFNGGRHGGDIKGIEDQLDYIQDMGFTAVWLNPVIENDMPDYSYHGYAATDFYRVDRRFGTNESYRKFIRKAQDRGIKVIMDMILNHCGSAHWFVKDSPMPDWINFEGKFRPTSHKRNAVQDIHASEYDKRAFSDGWFVVTMPDLNQRNELMADYLIQNTLWWIEYSSISGIRMDTYPYPDKDFMSDWTCAVMDEYPHFSIVGEEWTINPAIVSYWQRGKVNHDDYTSCLPSLMDFPLQFAVAESLKDTTEGWNTGMMKAYEALANDFLYADPDNLVVFPDNHDMDRFFTQVNEDVDLFKMGLVYFATVRGIPQLYYGTEIAMDNAGYPGDHGIIRTDFPGGWPDDEVNAFTGKGLTPMQRDVQSFTKKLLSWRKGASAVHHGKLIQFAPENGVYAYVRLTAEEKVMVLFNKNKEVYAQDMGKFGEVLGDAATAYEVMSGQQVDLTKPFTMQPKTAYILEIQVSEE